MAELLKNKTIRISRVGTREEELWPKFMNDKYIFKREGIRYCFVMFTGSVDNVETWKVIPIERAKKYITYMVSVTSL